MAALIVIKNFACFQNKEAALCTIVFGHCSGIKVQEPVNYRTIVNFEISADCLNKVGVQTAVVIVHQSKVEVL